MVGIVFAVTLPFVIHGVTVVRSMISRALLTSRAADQAEVEQLVAGREVAREAEAGALRRLERDIHDGPQQRVVRLSMDLGRARKQAGAIAPELQGPLDDALRQTQETSAPEVPFCAPGRNGSVSPWRQNGEAGSAVR